MAGDIRVTHITGYTYKFTIRTFTNTCNTNADRCELYFWTGLDSIAIPRINGPSVFCPATHDGVIICPCVKYNIYEGVRTFSGPGTYVFSLSDQNMNAGICNVPNSVNTAFTLSGELVINPFLGDNDTPEYTGTALMQNNVGIVSTYNPAVLNTEGDSLYFDFSLPIGVILPPASNSISINHQTGIITWDAPTMICNYAIDVTMKEYRNIGGTYYYIGTTMQKIYTDNTCTSDLLVNETNFGDRITISPNPFTEQTTISFSEEQKNTSILITDVLGNTIQQLTTNNKQLILDMSTVAKGIYFVQITDENKKVVNRKIILQ